MVENLADKSTNEATFLTTDILKPMSKKRRIVGGSSVVKGLKRHRASTHDIDVKWHKCDLCDYQCKYASHLKEHKANIHDIGVVWFECDICHDYKSKQKSRITRHIYRHHSEEYKARRKIQEEKVRTMLIKNNLKECYESDTMPPVGYFKREKRIDFTCANVDVSTTCAKIDFVIAIEGGGGYIFLEVDENQHKCGYGASVSCDMKRMTQVMESITIELLKQKRDIPSIYWLRYNPQAWYVNGERQYVPKEARQARLMKWLKDFRIKSHIPNGNMGVGYAFYDMDENGELEVLKKEEYNESIASLVDNLRGIEET